MTQVHRAIALLFKTASNQSERCDKFHRRVVFLDQLKGLRREQGHAVDRAKNEKEIHLASRGDQEEGGPKEGGREQGSRKTGRRDRRTVIADHATARTDSLTD